VVVQNPDFFGHVRDLNLLASACHEASALLIVVVTEVVSMGAITSPGAMGADIVAAEGQSIGNALNYGGPTVGLLAVHNKHLRQMPGRVCGQTTDVDGKRGFVLTLSTREQHIRRERATSNICTNSGLCALAFTVHMTLLGETGFAHLAQLNHGIAVILADRLSGIAGAEVINKTFFNEFTLRLSRPAAAAVEGMAAKGVLGGIPVSRLYPDNLDLENLMLVAATEVTTESDIDILISTLSEVL
jgi:glycine dehydrogenase subunit 1